MATIFWAIQTPGWINDPAGEVNTMYNHLQKGLVDFRNHMTGPHTSNFAGQLLCQYTSQPCLIKRAEKSFLQRKLPLSLPHKLGYTASQISREEDLTKIDNYLPDRHAKKHQNDPFVKAI
jgi:hypothetical protein